MYIHRLRVRNYSIHQDTSITLHPLTVLVGPNGGGKSALFDAILNFSMLSRGKIKQAFGPYPFSYRATLHRGASNVARIGYEVEMSREPNDADRLVYTIEYTQDRVVDEDPSFTIYRERLVRLPANEVVFDRDDPDRYPITATLRLEPDRSLFSAIRLSSQTQDRAANPLLAYCTQQISRFNKFRLDPFVLAGPCRLPELSSDPTDVVSPRLGYQGEDLAATLYYLLETDDPSLDRIGQLVRDVLPEFDGFEFNTVGTDRIAFAVKYDDRVFHLCVFPLAF